MSLYLRKRKKVLKKVCVGASLFILGAGAFSSLALLFEIAGQPRWMTHPLAPVLVVTLVTLLAFKPLDIAYTKFFKHYLFKKKTYAHMVLMNLADELQTVLDWQELSNLIVNTFGEVLQLKTVALLILDEKKDQFQISAAYGWRVSDLKRIVIDRQSPLIKFIESHGPHVLIRDRVIRTLAWQEANQLSHDLNSLQASWVVPLFVKERLIGALGFASSSPESIFDEADFQFFRVFAHSVAQSIHNGLRFEQLSNTIEKLKDSQSDMLQKTKLAAIEQLASGIAHEIHNPLTIISGKAQVLLLKKDKSRLDESVEEVLKTIVQQTKRAADITRKLLMFSQNSGSPREPLNLEQVLLDTVSLVSYQTSLDGIQITHAVKGPVPEFHANVHEIREVFLNLIQNAVESLAHGRGKIHCEITYRERDDLIEFLILDSGRGIAKENLEQLFNPFFTTQHGRAGLGLFITRQIIHRYGGSIRADSRVGEGSLFMLDFPAHVNGVRPQTSDALSVI